jgi:hypothetical protein
MKTKTARNLQTRPFAIALALALPTALTATGANAQQVTLTPGPNESTMIVTWSRPTDDFGPRPTCDTYYPLVYVTNDGTTVDTLNRYGAVIDPNGTCTLRWTIRTTWSDRIAPGVWHASATLNGGFAGSATRAINACTALQGKQAMYWASYAPLTDNFYTTSLSDINIAINAGFPYMGIPFYMPSPAEYHSRPFYRFYKGAPQFEHFYTHRMDEYQIVTQNGYIDEGVEGYIFTVSKPGTVPLYRYAYFNGTNGDLQHLYSLSANGPMGQPGWTSDGVVGYVCPQ